MKFGITLGTCLLTLVFSQTALADIRGIYAGNVTKVSEINNSFGKTSKRLNVKYVVDDSDGITEVLIPFAAENNTLEEVYFANGVASFKYDDSYSIGKNTDCSSEISVQIEQITTKSALLTYTFNDSCSDGSSAIVTYSGKIGRHQFNEDIGFNGGALKTKTSCFRIKKPTTFDWDFWDTGGFLALLKVTLVNCNTGQKDAAINIRRDVEEFYKKSSFTITRPGRYRFEIISTGDWQLEKRF